MMILNQKFANTVEMTWSLMGHAAGQCQFQDNTCIVHITKCASSAVKSNISWEIGNFNDQIFDTYICILRDPIDRWISGTAEYFHRAGVTRIDTFVDLFNHVVVPKISIDTHTLPQAVFLQGLKFETIDAYEFSPSVLQRIDTVYNCCSSFDTVHTTQEYEIKKTFSEYIHEALNKSKKFKNKVKSYYSIDYDLIERLNPKTD